MVQVRRRPVRRQAPTAALGVALGLVLLAEAVAFALLVGQPHLRSARLLLEIAGPLWVVAVALLGWLGSRGLGARPRAALVLGVGAVFCVLGLSHPAATSDDAYRYVWDAKVQLHGVDPYRYTPASPQLARLRDPSLFGAPSHCQHPFPGGCTSINRPDVHTIYPPVAEGAFDLVRIAAFGGHGGLRPLQIAGALGTLLIGWLLLRRARRPWLAAVWAWCPVPVVEYANNAHIDWLAVLLVVAAFATGIVRRTGWAGALVGAAVAVKLYPVLVLPSLMRRRPWVALGAAVGLVALVYVPHVLAVGAKVIGFLPGYLKQEDYASGGRLLLVGAVLPHPADTVVGALIVAALGLWAWRHGDPLAPADSAVVVVGVAFLVFTPSYGWYTGLLLALVAMTGALEWAPLCFAASFTFLDHGSHDALVYLGAAVLVALVALVRRLLPSRDDLGRIRGNPRIRPRSSAEDARCPQA